MEEAQQADYPQPEPEPSDPDDPSGEGWRDVEVGEVLQSGDMLSDGTRYVHTDAAGSRCAWQGVYRRRIEPQPSTDNLPNEVQVLIDLLRGVQDWSGTRVGDAIDVIEAQLFRRKVGQNV